MGRGVTPEDAILPIRLSGLSVSSEITLPTLAMVAGDSGSSLDRASCRMNVTPPRTVSSTTVPEGRAGAGVLSVLSSSSGPASAGRFRLATAARMASRKLSGMACLAALPSQCSRLGVRYFSCSELAVILYRTWS